MDVLRGEEDVFGTVLVARRIMYERVPQRCVYCARIEKRSDVRVALRIALPPRCRQDLSTAACCAASAVVRMRTCGLIIKAALRKRGGEGSFLSYWWHAA